MTVTYLYVDTQQGCTISWGWGNDILATELTLLNCRISLQSKATTKCIGVLKVSHTMSIPPPDLILLKHWPSAGYALVFPFILKSQIHHLLLRQPLHVGRQCDAMVCQLWDL